MDQSVRANTYPYQGGTYVFEDGHRQLVSQMSAAGLTKQQMARILRIDVDTLSRHFDHEIEAGRDEANLKVSQTLYQRATGDGPDAVAAIRWWEITRRGFSERRSVEHTGPDGKPLVPVLNVTLSKSEAS